MKDSHKAGLPLDLPLEEWGDDLNATGFEDDMAAEQWLHPAAIGSVKDLTLMYYQFLRLSQSRVILPHTVVRPGVRALQTHFLLRELRP